MRFIHTRSTLTAALALTTALPAFAHGGRRFEVKVVDDQLVTHGYITEGLDDDGGGLIRPYYNAIHAHFSNKTSNFATADLPGFDVLDDADALIGYDLQWIATGFKKWSSPDTAGPVDLTDLDMDEVIEVVYGGNSVRSDNAAASPSEFTLDLLPNFDGDNGEDLDLTYDFYGDNPLGEIYVIESILTTDAPGIADSTTVYTILSPDGDNPMQRLHHAALFTERSLGTPVPEPAVLSMAVLLPALLRRPRQVQM